MTKKLKATLSMFLCAVMVLCSVAVGGMFANADTNTGKAIQLVKDGAAANIIGGQASNLYFGTYKQSSDGNNGYNTDPIKWRVLANNTDSKQLFLLSDQGLDTVQYHTEKEDVTWEKSTIRSWLNETFYKSAFTSAEQEMIKSTKVTADANPRYNTDPGNDTTDKVFLLSINEANNSIYFSSNDARMCVLTDYAVAQGAATDSNYTVDGKATCWWWLRSPGNNSITAADIYYHGGLSYIGGYVDYDTACVRPAFNLNLESVIFTSAAVDGKKAATGTISKIADYSGSEWKLTLLDAVRNFDASVKSYSVTNKGGSVTVTYSGAQAGTNEYISAMLVDSNDNALYYGQLKNITDNSAATGELTVDIPAGLADGYYTLKLFNEQCNGDYKTDYASEPVDLAMLISDGDGIVSDKDSLGILKVKINSDSELIITYTDGTTVNLGVVVGEDGKDGKDGITPKLRINSSTNEWEVSYDNGSTYTSLGVKATGEKGADGINGKDGADGKDGKDGTNGTNGTNGKDGKDGENGKDGTNGKDGNTPLLRINEEGYWEISYDNGETYTSLGYKAIVDNSSTSGNSNSSVSSKSFFQKVADFFRNIFASIKRVFTR